MPPLQFLALLALGVGILGISGILGIPALGWSRAEQPAPSRPLPRRPRSEPARSWLRWVPFTGSVPADAVSSNLSGPSDHFGHSSGRSDRPQFICSTRTLGCNLGSFDPLRGPFCFFPWAGEERSSSDFQLLLNPGGFEALQWAEAAFGSAPAGAVEGCLGSELLVGRSPRGQLGKVSREQQALFVAAEGEELWYKWYQVLVVRQGAGDVRIEELEYGMERAEESAEEVELARALPRNAACQAATESLTLEEATEAEQEWSSELPALAAAHGALRAAPLLLSPGGAWSLGNVTLVPWAGGASSARFAPRRLHRLSAELPARSECAAVLRGVRRRIRVPFQAWLSREFRSGRPHRVRISGWAQSRAVSGVRAGLERCRRLSELPPCAP